MRILLIAPTPFFSDRGCHVRILGQIKALQEAGHACLLCTYHLGNDPEGVSLRRTMKIPWYKKLSAGPSNHKYYADLLLLWTSLKACVSFKPDVIHAYLHEGAWIGHFVRLFTRVPLLFDAQGSLSAELSEHKYCKADGWKMRTIQFLERHICTLPEVVTCSSAALAELMREECGVAEDRVFTIPDATDMERFSPQHVDSQFRENLGIGRDRDIIVYLGHMSDYQGVDDLIEMLPQVLKAHPCAHLLLGGYPDVAKYHERVESLGLSEHVTFAGRVPYMRAAEFINAGSVAVSAKRATSEGNGKLFNYMACARPTVVYETPLHRSILGEHGLYAERGDVNDFANQVIALLKSPDAAAEKGAALRAYCRANHSWGSVIEQLEGCYQRAIHFRKG